MDTITILNHYRTRLLSDDNLVQILARIYRDGAKSENELSADLKTKPIDLQESIASLFRGNLLRLTTNARWITTELGDYIMARLGISTVTARSILREQKIDVEEWQFLDACLAKTSDNDVVWSADQTSLLRTAVHLMPWFSKHKDWTKSSRVRLLYSTIIGLNPYYQKLGPSAFCRHIVDRLDATSPMRPSMEYALPKKSFRIYHAYCTQALHDVERSNMLFMHGDLPSPKDTSVVGPLTLVRMLSAVLSKRCDQSLEAASRSTEVNYMKLWTRLQLWDAGVDRRCASVLSALGRDDEARQSKKAGGLTALFLNVAQSTNPQECLHQWISSAEMSEDEPLERGATTTALLWSRALARLRLELVSGKLDVLPQRQQTNLFSRLEELSATFKERLISPRLSFEHPPLNQTPRK